MSCKNTVSFLFVAAAILIAVICGFYMTDSKTNLSNIEYINSCGWQVDNKCVDISYFTVPKEFDSVFSAYNDIVVVDGYDLSPYKGLRVVRYTYNVINHPESQNQPVRINIILYKNSIISADISASGVDGFIKPLSK